MPSITRQVVVLAYVHSFSVIAVDDRLASFASGEDDQEGTSVANTPPTVLHPNPFENGIVDGLEEALGTRGNKTVGSVYKRLEKGGMIDGQKVTSLHEVTTELVRQQIEMEKQIYDYKRACQAATMQMIQLSEMMKHSIDETNLILRQADTKRLVGIVQGREEIKKQDELDMQGLYAEDTGQIRRGTNADFLREMDEWGRKADLGHSLHTQGLLNQNAMMQQHKQRGIGYDATGVRSSTEAAGLLDSEQRTITPQKHDPTHNRGSFLTRMRGRSNS
jgi:hypothetical protein|mmetsp:Transcript_28605/g.46028  ORF Transcript_28605/g.46028 Transcript_28605/m.46028 type:complete len:276 (+) Transcript_28605:48-875(+)|eukprot:CAMPEP_0169130500 /NCGR_PEP_ID=MMETSP1015-20121227/37735_1 /TAXON_ID=342587 /ORGANISM="Karlodinium micrum, Strain CCMP2283" /LENGTH=275 /DNA_ID=CAMNT_0009194675 /DNA_START=48 /DNA_END=875 /DNA_ORIENTATION=-